MMMQSLRKASKTWLGKLVVGVLFGLLIISFAIWGIQDIFRGYGSRAVATVGGQDIPIDEMRVEFQTQLRGIQRQFGQGITADQARRIFRLDQAVLNTLINNAAVDARARQLGLAVADATIVKRISESPLFQDPQRRFDPARYAARLRDIGMNEARFEEEQRKLLMRQAIRETVTGAIGAPRPLLEILHRLRNETRTVSYLVLTEKQVTVAEPDEAAIARFFEQRKAQFRAPEYRAAQLLVLVPDTLAKPDEITEADARAHYAKIKDIRFGTPEKRRVFQMVFNTEDEAKAAHEKIKAGASFEKVAEERKVTEKDYDLGVAAKSAMVDPAIAEAAFKLEKGATSEPVKGRFGFAIVKTAEIEPGQIKPFEEVAAEVKRDLAREKVKKQLGEVHDKVEDMRASAKPMAEIASSLGLKVTTLDGVDAEGKDRAGKPLSDVPESRRIVAAIHATQIGADTEPVTTSDGGYVWYDLTKIDPAADRKIEDVRAEVVTALKAENLLTALAEKAAAVIKEIEGGKSFADAAKGLDVEVKVAKDIKRAGPTGDFGAPAVSQVFTTPVSKAGTAEGATTNTRLVFLVDEANLPELVTGSETEKQLATVLQPALAETLFEQYVARARSDVGVNINEAALRLAVGASAQ